MTFSYVDLSEQGIEEIEEVLSDVETTTDTLQELGMTLDESLSAVASDVGRLQVDCLEAEAMSGTSLGCDNIPDNETFTSGSNFTTVSIQNDMVSCKIGAISYLNYFYK